MELPKEAETMWLEPLSVMAWCYAPYVIWKVKGPALRLVRGTGKALMRRVPEGLRGWAQGQYERMVEAVEDKVSGAEATAAENSSPEDETSEKIKELKEAAGEELDPRIQFLLDRLKQVEGVNKKLEVSERQMREGH